MSARGVGARRLVLVGVAALLALLIGYAAAKGARRAWRSFVAWQGLRLNQRAWEAGFLERGLPVPEQGPRDGYWGARIARHVTDPTLGWVLPELHVPDLLEVDANGLQYAPSPGAPGTRLLIVGASTAFGGYASTMGETYFARLARMLAADGRPVAITVLATGAWKSEQEILALEAKGLATRPEIVLFLNGLNDVTNGSNARVRYGVETKPLDGSRWHPLYHEHDYADRVAVYLANMRIARDRLRQEGIGVVFALQPSLFEKRTRSALEDEVEEGALAALGSEAELRRAYEGIRQGLAALATQPGTHFVDCSRVFDGESATVFTDAWHFSDVGHRLLADRLAEQLAPLVGRKESS